MIRLRYMGVVMLLRVLAVATAATVLVPHTGQARTIYQDQGPAELPPVSFKGNQFVDSSGCIFMRAGFGSSTSWVPRVTRDRRVMCGFQPTFAQSQTRPNPVQSVSTAMPLNKPQVAAAAPTPAPEPKPSPKPALSPTPTIASNMGSAAAGGGAKVHAAQTSSYRSGTRVGALPGHDVQTTGGGAVAPSGPTVNGQAVRLVSMGDCPGYAPVVKKVYTLSDGRTALRCGPGNDYLVVRLARDVKEPVQTASAAAGGSRNAPVAPPAPLLPYHSGKTTRQVAASHTSAPVPAPQPAPVAASGWNGGKTYAARTSGSSGRVPFENTSDAAPVVPKGYKMAWTDGRLNPYRGPRSAEGDKAMDLVWTRTVPRRLINTTTMQDVGARYPGLTYPHTANPPVPTRMANATRTRPTRVASAAPRMTETLSTSNAVPASGGRYVQIASFGVPANAARTVRQLQAMGLPVALGKVRIKGQVVQSVMAGPFASHAQLEAALQRAHGAGFGDAYIR